MIYGEIVQRWRIAQGAVLRKWPHTLSESHLAHVSALLPTTRSQLIRCLRFASCSCA